MKGDLLLVIVIFAIFGCIQTMIQRKMLSRYHKEQISHLEVIAAILVAIQPLKIREHSKRVASISEKLATELRLPSERTGIVRAAGLLHEVREIDSIPGHLPIELEILAVADYFDTANSCSDPMPLDDAIEDIRREAGTRFNPTVVKALMKLMLRSEGKMMRTDRPVSGITVPVYPGNGRKGVS